MRYTVSTPLVRALVGSALVVALSASMNLAAPVEAGAAKRAKTITRKQVIDRSRAWVRQRVPYSQSSYHGGYRQDCSGFVSMAWALGTSYTTRSLPSKAKRISLRNLRPGDAVLTPGHVAIFGGWKNKRARTFYAYEARSWGKPAAKTVRRITSNSRYLRRPGIKNAKKTVARKPAVPTGTLRPSPTAESVTKGLLVPISPELTSIPETATSQSAGTETAPAPGL